MGYILAIDSGLTVTKAVIFDLSGQQIGVARRNVAQAMPAPRRVERDMAAFWHETAAAIREVLAISRVPAGQIAAIAATAHGDGIYLLDAETRPLGNGILSLDSRASDVVTKWGQHGISTQSLQLTGQMPHVSAPSALLSWIKTHEPARYARIAHVLSCKDWLRFCLTGTIGTDRTEASTAFADVQTQRWSPQALALFGLNGLETALPMISASYDLVGTVTPAAAAETGLLAGTPVAAGLHDVTASALGIGAHRLGVIGVVAGTYSINECLSATPQIGPDWFCRAAIEPGRWNNMAISPASSTNYDWFLETFCSADRAIAEANGSTIHAALAPEIEAGLRRASSVMYQPYLFGSPFGAAPSASLMGLRGWHNRGDILAALLEGIVFNHRHHIDILRQGFAAQTVRLTGGASRNPAVAQLFADILNLPVTVTQTDEAAAWGAALCAGAAVGAFGRFDDDPRDFDAISMIYTQNSDRTDHYKARYSIFCDAAAHMQPIWQALNPLDTQPRSKAPNHD